MIGGPMRYGSTFGVAFGIYAGIINHQSNKIVVPNTIKIKTLGVSSVLWLSGYGIVKLSHQHNRFLTNTNWLVASILGQGLMFCGSLGLAQQIAKYLTVGLINIVRK